MSHIINDLIVQNLFPQSSSVIPKSSLIDLFKSSIYKDNDLSSILNSKFDLKYNNTYNPSGKLNSIDYREYIQVNNLQVKKKALEIVNPTDSNDVKAEKILKWVQENFTYVSDIEQYKQDEYWAYPTESLQTLKGDCEDGAFLIHSLMLASGIPYERIRTYAGYVEAGINAPFGGHAWTIYKRESDNNWIELDWCYYPEKTPISERDSFEEDNKYVDAWWWMNALNTYDEYGKWGIDIYA